MKNYWKEVSVNTHSWRKQFFLMLTLFGSLTQTVNAKSFECLIEPSQVIEVRAPIEGLIEKITVDRGDSVTQGQVLIVLDMGIDRARYEQAKYKASMRGAQMAATSRLEFLGKKLDRNQELFLEQYISANDLDESKSGKKLASAELLEAKENSRVAELQIREIEEVMRLKTLLSPFDGVVIERSHHPGEVTKIDDRLPVLKLAKTNPLYVEVVLPASSLGNINVGDKARIKPNIEGLEEFSARVKVVDPIVDAASATLGIRLEVPNPDQKIPAGISCQAELQVLE